MKVGQRYPQIEKLFGASCLVLGLALNLTLTVGCQKGKVTSSSLRAVSGFSLRNSEMIFAIRAPTSFTITGNCTDQTANIELSFDNSYWTSAIATATSSTVSCSSTGTFSLTFSATATTNFAIVAPASQNVVYFRGNGSMGPSAAIPLTLALTAPPFNILTAGSNVTTTANGTLRSRIVATPRVPASSGYILGR